MNNTYLQENISGNAVAALLPVYGKELREELDAILSYWLKHTSDTINGGFIGRIDEDNIPDADAPKGAVLNSRILWAFASAYPITKNKAHLEMATIAFNYIRDHFIDHKYGGVYWSVTATGKPLDTKKQIYALAFAMYGCSAFYLATQNESAKKIAIDLFRTIEKYSFDSGHTGYLEAFTQQWEPSNDLRLSQKDANEKKTMNTHLHLLEAYTALYAIWPDAILKSKIVKLVNNFTRHIIDSETGHLHLFFNEIWTAKSTLISYGHDIETSWLLLAAAEKVADETLIKQVKQIAIKIAKAAAEGMDKDGGLWYEMDTATQQLVKQKHSWVQAEAMIGFFNCWQLTGDHRFLQQSVQSWAYIKAEIKDPVHGEWFWGREAGGNIMAGQDKVGIWKCPYHNSRACIEIIKRIGY